LQRCFLTKNTQEVFFKLESSFCEQLPRKVKVADILSTNECLPR
jgi:hypothetical protein